MKASKKFIKEILLKLANGFTYTETTEEYAPEKEVVDSSSLVLVKKKVTTHYVPPDMLAIKILMEDNKERVDDLASMTDEELIGLKNKIIQEIVGGEKN